MTHKIHMQQIRELFGHGWTRCGRGIGYEMVDDWQFVNCKQCLKHKRKKFAQT